MTDSCRPCSAASDFSAWMRGQSCSTSHEKSSTSAVVDELREAVSAGFENMAPAEKIAARARIREAAKAFSGSEFELLDGADELAWLHELSAGAAVEIEGRTSASPKASLSAFSRHARRMADLAFKPSSGPSTDELSEQVLDGLDPYAGTKKLPFFSRLVRNASRLLGVAKDLAVTAPAGVFSAVAFMLNKAATALMSGGHKRLNFRDALASDDLRVLNGDTRHSSARLLERAAVCAKDCYSDSDGFSDSETPLKRTASFHGRSGLAAAAYEDGERIVLAFRGTEKWRVGDHFSNILQHACGAETAPQYQQAKATVKKLCEAVLAERAQGQAQTQELLICGHSLGGGLAQYAAAANANLIEELEGAGVRVRVVAFNPAALSRKSVEELGRGGRALLGRISASYRNDGEALSGAVLGRGYSFNENAFEGTGRHDMDDCLAWAKRVLAEVAEEFSAPWERKVISPAGSVAAGSPAAELLAAASSSRTARWPPKLDPEAGPAPLTVSGSSRARA